MGKKKFIGSVALSNNLVICGNLDQTIMLKKTVWATQDSIQVLDIVMDGSEELQPQNDKLNELVEITK